MTARSLAVDSQKNFIAAPQAKNDRIFCFSPQNDTSFTQDHVSLAFEDVLRFAFHHRVRNKKTFPNGVFIVTKAPVVVEILPFEFDSIQLEYIYMFENNKKDFRSPFCFD